MSVIFHSLKVWKKFVEVRTITDSGAYAKDQVPESYGGAELDVEIIQRVIFTDSSGQLVELRMDDIEGLKDQEDKTGMAVQVIDTDGTVLETIAATGDSTITIQWVGKTTFGAEDPVNQKATAVNALMGAQKTEEEG